MFKLIVYILAITFSMVERMYNDTLQHFAGLAKTKASLLQESPLGFVVGSLMAGAYIGFGIILIFSVAGSVDPSLQKLVMGLSFGIALTLVVFAGAELFTGYTLYMTVGILYRKTTFKQLCSTWSISWLFNLAGSVVLALLFVAGRGGEVLHEGVILLNQVAAYKMNSSATDLLARAILCNWLVCLALWMAARCSSDSGKAIVIFWCLFAFISSGYEHSVANMTLLSIALLGQHTETISLAGMAHNLFWVTLGNIIGGSLFMGMGYWAASGAKRPESSFDENDVVHEQV